jgi:hypothetical protein
MNWRCWKEHFEVNRARPLPTLELPRTLSASQQEALAWSLVRFQLGEAGEGRIAREIYDIDLPGIDDSYRQALGLFVKEEGRHARILAGMVRMLGSSLLRHTWSERLFVVGRRLCGIRLKLLVLLAAEVVSIGFYSLLAAALPVGALRVALQEITEDERSHLRFHRDFFQTVAPDGWRRALFLGGWALVGVLASGVALWDHRRTLRALAISRAGAAKQLASLLVAAAQHGATQRPTLHVEVAP